MAQDDAERTVASGTPKDEAPDRTNDPQDAIRRVRRDLGYVLAREPGGSIIATEENTEKLLEALRAAFQEERETLLELIAEQRRKDP